MSPDFRYPSAALAVAGFVIVCIGAIAVSTYVAGRQVGDSEPCRPAFAWIGPTGSAFEATVTARLAQALTALNNEGQPIGDRTPAYLSKLQAIEALLQRALIANPVDARGITRLAAVRWELSVLLPSRAGSDTAALLNLVEARAPRIADVYIELGTMLYRIGRGDEAPQRFAMAITLAPAAAHRAVELMRSLGAEPSVIASALPKTAEVVLALESSFLENGLEREYLALIEQRLDSNPGSLLWSYGSVCLRTGQSDALLARLSTPFRATDPRVEPLRLIQRARACADLGDLNAAIQQLDRARSLAPNDPGILEAIGVVELTNRLGTSAVADFQGALAAFAARQESAHTRGRLYREIGQAEELGGHSDLAFDAYRRALRLDASDEFSRGRLAVMERAAGYREPATDER